MGRSPRPIRILADVLAASRGLVDAIVFAHVASPRPRRSRLFNVGFLREDLTS